MKEIPWLHKTILIILIPVFCYLPVFGLVLLSSNMFKPSSSPDTTTKSSSTTIPLLSASSPNATPSSVDPTKNQSSLTPPDPSIYTDWIKLSVESEVRKQSGQAAKDEIEKLKSEYKGDIFVQIAFPVIFAIASIFAAFAVKDIVGKLLEQQEGDRIKRELEITLTSQIVPKAINERDQENSKRLDDIEAYAYWLEHQILSIMLTQAIDELKGSSISSQNEPKLLSAIQKLGNRSMITLEKASYNFRNKYFIDIKKYEEKFIQTKLNGVNLKAKESKKEMETILSTFGKPIQTQVEQEVYQGQNLFQAQMSLLRIALNRSLIGDKCSTELQELLNKLDEEISKDPRVERQEKMKIVDKREQESTVKPPDWDDLV